MTVRIHTTLPGINQEQFDAMNKLIMANEPPNGLIEGGWQVIDFWESRQAYDAAMPVVQKAIESAGVTPQGPPSVEEFAVHEIIRP